MSRIGKMAVFFEKSLIVLFCASIVSSLDLSALIPGGGAHQLANLKSIMNPDLLNKMKGMLPKSPLGSSPDVSEIEKLIGKLKPAEGRFDPAMMEFLANLDSSKNKVRPRVPSRSKGHGSSQDHETSTPTFPSPSTTESPPEEAEDEEKPKFSSRFRLPPPQHPSSQNSEDSSGPLPDHITDPNIRNHRLYDDSFQDSGSHSHGQERYENYENFTTIDQLEDLMADESYSAPHVVVAVPVTTTAAPRVSRHGVSPSYEHTTRRHPYKRRPSTMTPTLRRPSMEPSTTASSFEDFISLESFERHPHSEDEDDDMGPFHDREPLNLASTERTVSYPDEFSHNYASSTEGLNDVDEGSSSSSSVKTGSGGGFKPSPLDLSPPVYFVPGQDFYTTTLKNHGNKKSGPRIKIVSNKKPAGPPSSQITRRRQSSVQEEYAGDHESSPSNQWQQFDGYPKEQPDFHHAVDYYKKQQELIPTKNAFVHPSRYAHHSNRPGGQMTQSPSSIVPQSLPPPLMSPKQDRVLNGVGGTTYTYSSQNYAPTPAYSNSFGYQQQNPSASENVYHDVQMNQMNPYTSNPNNNYLPIQSDLSHSAGQNYYATNPVATQQHQPQQPYQAPGHHSYSASSAHGYADQQAHDSGHHHNLHHHGGGHHETSSWSSTFFVLGGLVALSGIIAFLLPTFLATAGATAGGKDTGDDKISHDETDLWSEIKALYNDIVHIAKGDYASYVHNGGSYKNDLPKIKYEEIDDESEDAGNSTTTSRTSQSEEDFQSVNRLGYPIRTPGSAEDEDTTSSGADEEDSIESNEEDVEENRVQDSKPTKKSKRKTTPSFHNPFIPYNTTTTTLQPTPPGRDNGINFAHAFNQTLHAWEVVPLIPT